MPKLNKQQNKQLSPNKEHTNIKLTLWKKPIILLLLFFIFNILTAEKLGYALSGGGARGFAHIGVLKLCLSDSNGGSVSPNRRTAKKMLNWDASQIKHIRRSKCSEGNSLTDILYAYLSH